MSKTVLQFKCFQCSGPVSMLEDGTPAFCDECKSLYWMQDGEIEVRTPKRVDPEPRGTC